MTVLLKVIILKTNLKFLVIFGALIFAGLIGGCATGSSSSPGSMGDKAGMSGGQMDMQAMCEKHKAMMAGRSTAEQQTMMNEHMKSMSPEMRARMQTMHEKCTTS